MGNCTSIPASVVYQASSAQNHQYAEVAYFGVPCSNPLHSQISGGMLNMEPWVPSPENWVLRASGRFLSLRNGTLKIDFLKVKIT